MAPRQRTSAVQKATVTVTTGERSALTLRALRAAATVAWLTAARRSSSVRSCAEGFDDLHGLEALLDYGDDLALLFADFVGGGLDGFFEARDEEEQEGCDGEGDEGEVPVEPEHEAEHADDGEHVDEDVEGGGGGEALDGLDVGGEGAEDGAGLVGVVVAEREALEVAVHAHAEVVRDPLAGALGEVVVDVGGDGAEHGDDDVEAGGDGGDLGFRAAFEERTKEVMEPRGHLVVADDVVEDDLERPGCGETHEGLDQHGEEDDDQGLAIGADQATDEAQHRVRIPRGEVLPMVADEGLHEEVGDEGA